MPTIDETIARGTELMAAASDSARADAQLLLAHILDTSRDWLIAHGKEPLADGTAQKFREVCLVRADGMPIPYITGSAGFYGREFIVNENVLIPRPETEHLIDEALAFLKETVRDEAPRVLDVGTGSGAIACTIAAEVPATLVDAIDNSQAALDVAKRNATALGVAERVHLYLGDLLAPIEKRGGSYDLVVANLPYIPTADIPERPNPVGFEPREALDGGTSGLELYQRLLFDLPRFLKDDALVLFEAAPTVIRGLYSLAQERLEREAIELSAQFAISIQLGVERDYGGLERYLRARVRRAPG